MTRPIVPIRSLARRMPEQGRIRIGKKVAGVTKGGKAYTRPAKIKAFRFTSSDAEAIHEIAAKYGGTAAPWADAPEAGQWEVYTDATSIPIALPEDPLGGTPIYEAWGGGYVLRRCDGEQCEVPVVTEDGGEMTSVPCLCEANNERLCKPKTRLTVILREIRFGGGWRLESGGWNTAHELPGMVDNIQGLQKANIIRGVLALEERKNVVQTTKGVRTDKFVVPVLRTDVSVDDLVGGLGNLGALAAGEQTRPLALETGMQEPVRGTGELAGAVWPDPINPLGEDDHIVDAEIVDDPPPAPKAQPKLQTALVLRVNELCDWHQQMSGEVLDSDVVRHAFARAISGGQHATSSALTDDQKRDVLRALDDILEGRAVFGGIGASGLPKVRKK